MGGKEVLDLTGKMMFSEGEEAAGARWTKLRHETGTYYKWTAWTAIGKLFFSYIFLGVFVYTEYLCRLSEASTQYCVIPGGYPPQDR